MSRMLFRVDANNVIGRGHLSRTIAVAEMFREKFEIIFVVIADNKNYCAPLLQDWTAAYINNDHNIEAVLKGDDIIWLDGYHFNNAWVSELKKKVKLVVEINDLPEDAYGADVIVNHCPGISEDQYKGINAIKILTGLNYAMLRPAFLESAKQTAQAATGVDGVFVCFGGADPYRIGYHFVDLLLKQGFQDRIYLVTPDASIHFGDHETGRNVKVLSNLNQEEMTFYMKASRVVVVPSSTLSFEAIALRKPVYTVYYVDNQQYIYAGLVAEQLAYGAGHVQSAGDVEQMILPFEDFYRDDAAQHAMTNAQVKALDGYSGLRLHEAVSRLSNNIS
ncbi:MULTISPECIES: hypothetical protein [unclassified Mucilaginibacter]|uniref:hypothetical protein n=1 Tax=unclassified Mucilaginibacter TaxID=2617802 RepID=UPI000968ADC8|nr:MULTISPECIES: hypothetical protein [unclassified Mucilaginibacter]OJW15131.1 MAG: hypothetical protein BGO48_13365 [Mucilaginibacter sp. 44-25]PLW91130.1 MAG: hypothetical protein C0154_02850 [Mucilaginibacter sp.]PMP64805.1 MAG: hypothetical protein C0191_05405 [Mucilaginibacter sp.]HEK19152.1 hypothetical protein [Bacteroidota bacterium]